MSVINHISLNRNEVRYDNYDDPMISLVVLAAAGASDLSTELLCAMRAMKQDEQITGKGSCIDMLFFLCVLLQIIIINAR